LKKYFSHYQYWSVSKRFSNRLWVEHWNVTIAGPQAGAVPIDAESLKPFFLDKITHQYFHRTAFMEAFNHAKPLAVSHATRYDFPNETNIQSIIARKTHSALEK